jgi:L-threonylcarbamoyladenylate synthase
MIRIAVNPAQPDPAALEKAAAVIREGRVVAVPTDTLYGLAADPFNTDAVARVFAIKARSAGRALPLVASDVPQVVKWLGGLSKRAAKLANKFWPGPLTLLMPATDRLAPLVSAGTGRVGVRVPAHVVARELCRAAGCPLTATSANISGDPATNDPEVAASLQHVDLLLDAGPTPGGPSSTIVDVTGKELRLVRPGAISWEDVQAALRAG